MSERPDYRDLTFDVFFDFQCPFVNAAATWLREVEEQLGHPLKVTWRAFPLEQVNSKAGDDWKLWEQPEDYQSRGLPAFRAALAAKAQGEQAYHGFVWALLNLRHIDGHELADPATLTEAATRAGLDLDRFETDRANRDALTQIGTDYTDAIEQYGVFGTPTFVFPNGQGAYLKLKLRDVPTGPEALAFFDHFVSVVRDTPKVMEIKRPNGPVV
ncbi:MAG TPA: DsbA family protein [Thermomicrobiales bacterium]|jgi:predicted DsbA family dithiol-disulfide isomerase|nr:DsbA family protein [Thermomicrobiales bacterium]